MGFHNPTRQRGIFANTAETQERNPSLTRRVMIRSRARCVGECSLWKLELIGSWEITKTKDSLADKSGVLRIMELVNSLREIQVLRVVDLFVHLGHVLLWSSYCRLFRSRNSSVGKCPS